MKNSKYIVWALIAAIPTMLMAQPADEEVSPIAPELSIEIMDAPEAVEPAPAKPAHSQIQPVIPAAKPAAAPKVPVVEAKPAAAPKEDNSVKGITLSPSITVKPFGYNADSKQGYFEIAPAAAIDTTFKTAAGRDVSLNFGYTFTLDEFFSKRDTAGLRSFDHLVEGSATINWTDNFSTRFAGNFEYALTAALERGHELVSDNSATGTFKINDQVSVSTGYHLFYYNAVDAKFYLSDGNLPNDRDEVRQGNSVLGAYDPYNSDPFTINTYDPVVGSQWFANNGIQLKTTFKPVPSTPLGLNYEYVFNTFTNSPETAWRGHIIGASIGQDLPWKGGKLNLIGQLRLRNYDTATNPADGSPKANLRNRVTLVLAQQMTDSISAELFYRWELRATNADEYAKKDGFHYIYAGFTFGF